MSEQDNHLRDQVNSGNTPTSPGAAQHNGSPSNPGMPGNNAPRDVRSSAGHAGPSAVDVQTSSAEGSQTPCAGDAQAPLEAPQINTYLYSRPNSEDAQTLPELAQVNTYWYTPSDLETLPTQPGISNMNGQWHGETNGETNSETTPGSSAIPSVNGHWHEEANTETSQPSSSTPNTSSAPQVNGITGNNPASNISQATRSRRRRQTNLPRPQVVPPPEPGTAMHRVVIEFEAPTTEVPVVLPELRASGTGSYYISRSGGAVPRLSEQPQASEQPRTSDQSQTAEESGTSHESETSEQPQSPEYSISYSPIRPSPRTNNSTSPPETLLPLTPASQSIDEAIWHEFDTVLTPEAIAAQETLLSTWNEAASAARSRIAAEAAHIRAVELESELLSDEQERQQRQTQDVNHRQTQTINDGRSGTAPLPSEMLARARRRVRDTPETPEQTQTQTQNLGQQNRPNSSLHRLTQFISTLSSASTACISARSPSRSNTRPHLSPPHPAPAPQPPTPTPTSPSTPPLPPQDQEHDGEDLCTLCTINKGTLIQGPLSQPLTDTIPFVCCQKCLDEILEAEVQITGENGGERDG